jgi:DNA-binding transcriptional regulator YiaG
MSADKRTIREMRESLGWSQWKLATMLGVTLGAVQSWEANRSEPRLGQQRKILEVFDVCWEKVEWPDRAKKMIPAA